MIGVPGPEVVAGVFAGDRIDRIGPQLAAPGRFGDRVADLFPHLDLVGADRRLHLEGRHAGVLADGAFAVGREVDVLRDDRERLAGLRRRAAPPPSPTFIAARTSGGRSVEVFTTSESTLSKNWGSISRKYNLSVGSTCSFEPSAILSVNTRFPPTRITASRPRGPSKISASATCARLPISSSRRCSSRRAAAEANEALGRLDARVAAAIVQAATKFAAAACAISSSSTSTRRAPAPRTT